MARNFNMKFKCPNELGITQQEFDLLLEVRNKLARGEMKHRKRERYFGRDEKFEVPTFNMATWSEHLGCGQVGCIAGWMEVESKGKWHHSSTDWKSENLRKLFLPGDNINMDKITTHRAVRAIDNFLQGKISNPWAGTRNEAVKNKAA